MLQLIAHLIGDYVLQNQWMANRKAPNIKVAILHALLYSAPFVIFFGLSWAIMVIFATHAVIDHWRLTKHWCKFWGIGTEGAVKRWVDMLILEAYLIVPRAYTPYKWDRKAREYLARATPDAPKHIKDWLLIIVDNTTHLGINALALWWIGGI